MIDFYATIDCDSVREYMPAVPVMLPASSWSRKNMKAPKLPDHVTRRAADCGGFVATKIWGEYRYTPERYTDWLATFSPEWAATMDYCCENEITTGNTGVVRERQQKTTDMAYFFWEHFKTASWTWVPTVQGWKVEEYRQHAKELAPLVTEMYMHYGKESAFRVGIGTLCRRASVPMIHQVVHAVSDELPDIPLHLWGVKLSALQAIEAMPEQVISVDSAAWNGLFAKGREKYHKSGMTQREYLYKEALPTYLRRFQQAIEAPKQLSLFS